MGLGLGFVGTMAQRKRVCCWKIRVKIPWFVLTYGHELRTVESKCDPMQQKDEKCPKMKITHITHTNGWKDTLLRSINEKIIEFLVLILQFWKYWNYVNVMEKLPQFSCVFYDRTWTTGSIFKSYTSFFGWLGVGRGEDWKVLEYLVLHDFYAVEGLKRNILQTEILPYHIPDTK